MESPGRSRPGDSVYMAPLKGELSAQPTEGSNPSGLAPLGHLPLQGRQSGQSLTRLFTHRRLRSSAQPITHLTSSSACTHKYIVTMGTAV